MGEMLLLKSCGQLVAWTWRTQMWFLIQEYELYDQKGIVVFHRVPLQMFGRGSLLQALIDDRVPLDIFRFADSGQTWPYSSLGKCFTLKVMEITKQVWVFFFCFTVKARAHYPKLLVKASINNYNRLLLKACFYVEEFSFDEELPYPPLESSFCPC